MPINIKEDRRLRVIWCKYQNILVDMKSYYYRTNSVKNEMDVNKLSSSEATIAFEEEIRKIEQQRRAEMNQIRKQIIAEKNGSYTISEQEEARNRLIALEEIRIARELRNERMKDSPPRLRRSAGINSKTTDDPSASWKCGSIYKKA